MNRLKQRTIWAMMILFLIAIAFLSVSTVHAISVDNCKDIGIDSCDIDGLDAMCDKLFSNPAESCEKICRSTVGDDKKVGACVICCQNVRAQLDLEPPLVVPPPE